MPLISKLFLVFLSLMLMDGQAFSSNSSNEIGREGLSNDSTKDLLELRNRQAGTFAVSGPVAASLAFVGLNLAFISLLVPFVITAVTVGERRNYIEDREEAQDTTLNKWSKLRSTSGWDLQDYDYPSRSSSTDHREMMDKIAKVGQKLMDQVKAVNQKNKTLTKKNVYS